MNAKKNLMAFILTVSSIALMVICLGLGMVKACAGGDGSEWKEKVAADTLHVVHYTRPDLPQIMTDPAERAVYYVKHYWDGYLTGDTAWVNSGDTEQLYVDFIDALKYVEPETGRKALHTMMVRMEADSTAYRRFCLLGEKYLNEPNSPMRNEDFYIAVLEQMLQSDRLPGMGEDPSGRPIEAGTQESPGNESGRFTYVTVHGDNSRMSRLKAQYTMLFFYDPDCSNCRKFEKLFAEIPAFVEMVENGTLRVLAIYPDENREEWAAKAVYMPQGWIVGWNKAGDIRTRQLYDIRATPTIYLLDGRKRVILKDTSMEQLIDYLATQARRVILDNTSLQIAPVLSSDKSMYNSGCRLFLSGITGRETGAFDYFKPVYSSFIVNCIRFRSRSMLSTFTVTCW